MDFGVPGSDTAMGPVNEAPSQSQSKLVGSEFPKQERSSESTEDHWKCSKLQRTDSLLTPKTMPLNQGTPLLRSNSEHMLSFSSLKSEVPFINKDGDFSEMSAQNNGFSYYQYTPSTYARNAGYGYGSLNPSMHEPFNGFRGPLTPSQLTELQHQALIYKYITSNVAVPSNLIIPLKKSLCPYGFTSSSAGSLPPSSLGWGAFHLRYSGSTDPEPGRCRRTDGKKWRCSRDAVAEQKYCERHINRGRHRSRKPVEGQTGHAASGTTNPKVVPMSSPMSASVITCSGASSSLTISQQHQFENLQSGATDQFPNTLVNRIQDPRTLPVMSSTSNLKSNNSTFTITKQGVPFAESSQSDFRHVAFDSLVNLSHGSSNMDSKEYGHLLDFTTDQETQGQNPHHRFIDDWPKDESIHSVITWPGELRSDRTQLSIEFSSSSSSPAQEKLAVSHLRPSREFDPVQMSSLLNSDIGNPNQNHAHWIPVPWGSSTGGPLGEVLTNTASNASSCKNSSPLSLLSEDWSGSQLSQSPLPTSVLQTTPFGSLSNSSSGSSPVSENKKLHNGSSLCDDVLGSTLITPALIPSAFWS